MIHLSVIMVLFSLVCSDLSSIDTIQDVIMNMFGSASEEVRSAASYALGNPQKYILYMNNNHIHVIVHMCTHHSVYVYHTCLSIGCVCAGNLERYLPFILTEIQNAPKKQYLLLHSLKEIITCYGSREGGYDPLKPYVGQIWYV